MDVIGISDNIDRDGVAYTIWNPVLEALMGTEDSLVEIVGADKISNPEDIINMYLMIAVSHMDEMLEIIREEFGDEQ